MKNDKAHATVLPFDRPTPFGNAKELEGKVIDGIMTMLDRWAFIHRYAAPSSLTETQKISYIKREVLKRLQESL